MSDTEQKRQEIVKSWARVLMPYALAALGIGGGVVGMEHVNNVENDKGMLMQHTEALRERVDYLEGWIMRHNRQHMEGGQGTDHGE